MLRINAILSEDLVLELDRIARLEHKSRSEMLREAARNLIADYHRKQEELQRKARMREAMAIQDRLREKAGVWDGVAEVRKWRDEVR